MNENIKILKKFIDDIAIIEKEKYTDESWEQFDIQIKKQYSELVKSYLNLRLKPNKNLIKKAGN